MTSKWIKLSYRLTSFFNRHASVFNCLYFSRPQNQYSSPPKSAFCPGEKRRKTKHPPKIGSIHNPKYGEQKRKICFLSVVRTVVSKKITGTCDRKCDLCTIVVAVRQTLGSAALVFVEFFQFRCGFVIILVQHVWGISH